MSWSKNNILLGLIMFCCSIVIKAQDTLSAKSPESSPFRFSVLTCTPGTDAYAHFGHTAILLEDTINKRNAVFNYGCFDDSQKNFILNFMAGNTNYLLEAESLEFFLWRYKQTGNGVTRQELSLTANESQQLWDLLVWNMQRENQTYLYNWLYDNCTERARDIIEKAIDGKVTYERSSISLTAREMLHEKLVNAPWLQFGIDIILGSEIDKPIGKRIQMFLPDFYEAELTKAYIVDSNGIKRPLISKTEIMQKPTELSREVASPITPTIVFLFILGLVTCLSIIDIIRKKLFIWLDILLLTSQGITGIVVAGLFFFSKHPAVDSNWMVIAFNPLFLIYAIFLIYNWKTNKGEIWKKNIETVNLAVLLVFCVVLFLPYQWFHPVVNLMVLTLLIRCIVRLVFYYKLGITRKAEKE